MRQFHEDREGKKHKLQEFYLGKWDSKQLETMDKSTYSRFDSILCITA